MNSTICVGLAAVMLAAAPNISFAQESNGPRTRAEVRAELVETENAGYQPGGGDTYYLANIQKAEAALAAARAGQPID